MNTNMITLINLEQYSNVHIKILMEICNTLILFFMYSICKQVKIGWQIDVLDIHGLVEILKKIYNNQKKIL